MFLCFSGIGVIEETSAAGQILNTDGKVGEQNTGDKSVEIIVDRYKIKTKSENTPKFSTLFSFVNFRKIPQSLI